MIEKSSFVRKWVEQESIPYPIQNYLQNIKLENSAFWGKFNRQTSTIRFSLKAQTYVVIEKMPSAAVRHVFRTYPTHMGFLAKRKKNHSFYCILYTYIIGIHSPILLSTNRSKMLNLKV